MCSALEINRDEGSGVTYEEFQARSHFSEEEVLAIAHGSHIDDAPPGCNARLPLTPELLVARYGHVSSLGHR